MRGFLALACSGMLCVCCASAPETPEKGVLDYGNAVELKDDNAAWSHLCAEVKREALTGAGDRLRVIAQFEAQHGGVEVKDAPTINGDRADQPIRALRRGGQGDYEDWTFHMVKEAGRWRVCGLSQNQ